MLCDTLFGKLFRITFSGSFGIFFSAYSPLHGRLGLVSAAYIQRGGGLAKAAASLPFMRGTNVQVCTTRYAGSLPPLRQTACYGQPLSVFMCISLSIPNVLYSQSRELLFALEVYRNCFLMQPIRKV